MIMDVDVDSSAARGLHEYVRCVAAALGLRGESWLVQLESPANVYLALDERLSAFPDGDVAVTWDEEHGWALGVESNPGAELLVLGYLGDDVLPAPEVVAAAVRRSVVGTLPRNGRPAYRAAGDADDLLSRLAAYAVPVDLGSGLTVFYVDAESSALSPTC